MRIENGFGMFLLYNVLKFPIGSYSHSISMIMDSHIGASPSNRYARIFNTFSMSHHDTKKERFLLCDISLMTETDSILNTGQYVIFPGTQVTRQ